MLRPARKPKPPPSEPDPTRALWIAAAALAVSAIVFLMALGSVTELGTTVRSDHSLFDFVITHRSAWITHIARFFTALGSGWVVAPVTTFAVIVLAFRGRLAIAGVLAASTIGTALSVSLVKALVDRSRPPIGDHLVNAIGAAFPSGHAAQSVACYAALAWVVTGLTRSRSIRAGAWSIAAVIALGVGWSRVYLGVHWPSDVVGGWSLAGAWLALLVLVHIVTTTGPVRTSDQHP